MEHIGRKKTRGRGLPGRKKKRRRAAKALAAAGAIAGGTQAYAAPVRFDNPPSGDPGHFDWTTPNPAQSHRWLDVTLGAEGQPSGSGGVTSAFGQPADAYYGEVNARDDLGIAALQVGGYLDYNVVGVAGGESIPGGFAWRGNGYACYQGCETPEGETSYLGVKFDLGVGVQYGWIGVVRTGTLFETFAWGHETDPGVPIAAGAGGGGGEVIPTVSEWGLLSMTLAGLAIGSWTYRKKLAGPRPSAA